MKMKCFILVALISFDWVTNAETVPQQITNDDCSSFMELAKHNMRECMGNYNEFNVHDMDRKFNESFVLNTMADYATQKQLIGEGCDYVNVIIECIEIYRDSIPVTCMDVEFLEAELVQNEFQRKVHDYVCSNNLKKALAVVKMGGFRDIFISQFMVDCVKPSGDISFYVLENDRPRLNYEFCENSRKAYECMREKFGTSQNRNINLFLREIYEIAREIMDCDNEF